MSHALFVIQLYSDSVYLPLLILDAVDYWTSFMPGKETRSLIYVHVSPTACMRVRVYTYMRTQRRVWESQVPLGIISGPDKGASACSPKGRSVVVQEKRFRNTEHGGAHVRDGDAAGEIRKGRQ